MNELISFTTSKTKPLPVFILADVSGSMDVEGKIDVLNQAMADMIHSFGEVRDVRAEIHVSVLTFGGMRANVHTALTSARDTAWVDMEANGATPMGDAFRLLTELIDDKQTVPSKSYRPIVVLLSDGQPTDAWKEELEKLNQSRAAKAERMALAIGRDADRGTLLEFVKQDRECLFEAADAAKIRDFFRFVTMSVTARSRSANPNMLIKAQDIFELGDF